MIHCDALIVGGGPAGLAAAIALRQKGIDVLVSDALSPPVDKACGEGLMPDSREALEKLGVLLGPEDGHCFEGIAFIAPPLRATAPFSGRPGLGVRRLRLHAKLTDRCRRLGVRLLWGSGVTVRRGEPVLVQSESCRYRYLIGADGQFSRVRSWSGLERGKVLSKRFGARRHFRIEPWSRMVEVHWGDRGQAYVTPIGPEEVCIAAVSRSPSARMDEVLAGLPELRQRIEGAPVVSAIRGAATTTRRLRRVAAVNVALIGDASASVDAITGEGLALGFRQALLLAEAVEADSLDLYSAGHPSIVRLPQAMSRLLLCLDRWPSLRSRALTVLAQEPETFPAMLSMHLAQEPLSRFLLCNGTRLAWRLLAATPGSRAS